MMALCFRPIDRFLLGLEGLENMVFVILDHIILNRRTLVAPLRARLNIDVTHAVPSWPICLRQRKLHKATSFARATPGSHVPDRREHASVEMVEQVAVERPPPRIVGVERHDNPSSRG